MRYTMAYSKENRKKDYCYKLPEILDILDDVTEEYVTSPEMSYMMLLLKRNIIPTQIGYWKLNHPEVQEKIDILNNVLKVKYESALLNGTGNPTSLIWYGKCHLKMVPEEVKLKIESDAKVIEDVALAVNFTVAQHRSDDDISRLLESK
jgi:hypothetical protein